MKFAKNHKVILGTLDKDTAKVYIFFLNTERIRHHLEIERVQKIINEKRHLESKFNKTYIDLLNSACQRHEEDIEDAGKLIQKVREKFNL